MGRGGQAPAAGHTAPPGHPAAPTAAGVKGPGTPGLVPWACHVPSHSPQVNGSPEHRVEGGLPWGPRKERKPCPFVPPVPALLLGPQYPWGQEQGPASEVERRAWGALGLPTVSTDPRLQNQTGGMGGSPGSKFQQEGPLACPPGLHVGPLGPASAGLAPEATSRRTGWHLAVPGAPTPWSSGRSRSLWFPVGDKMGLFLLCFPSNSVSRQLRPALPAVQSLPWPSREGNSWWQAP